MQLSTTAYVEVDGHSAEVTAFISAVQRGDKQATRWLIAQMRQDLVAKSETAPGLILFSQAFRGKILGWIQYKRFPHDPRAAEEVWNDTLVRVWSRIRSYDKSKSALLTWAMNQAKWAASDYSADSRRNRETPAGTPGDSPGRDASALTLSLLNEAKREAEEPEPLTVFEKRALSRARRRLTETQRRLLHLRFICDLSHGEIARSRLAGDIPEAHVRVYVNRAAKRLRCFYDEELKRESRKEVVRENG
jgi:RNA polymerase sigma factor (sigma-70 family)